MMPEFIDKAGHYSRGVFYGEDPYLVQSDVALRVRLKNDNDVLSFDHLRLLDCGMPLRHERGRLEVGVLEATDFSADLWNSIGNMHIKTLLVKYDFEDSLYDDRLHVDALGQFFSLDGNGVGNVRIDNIYAKITGESVQGMTVTEPERAYNFQIGKNGLVDIDIDYRYAFLANTLEDSYINMGNAGVRIKKVKESEWDSADTVVRHHVGQDVVIDQGVYLA